MRRRIILDCEEALIHRAGSIAWEFLNDKDNVSQDSVGYLSGKDKFLVRKTALGCSITQSRD